jgi:hypothetical protein
VEDIVFHAQAMENQVRVRESGQEHCAQQVVTMRMVEPENMLQVHLLEQDVSDTYQSTKSEFLSCFVSTGKVILSFQHSLQGEVGCQQRGPSR